MLLRGLERGHEDVELRRVTPRHTSSHLERGHEDVELRRVGQKAERDEVLGDEREVAVLEPERDADQAEPRLGRDLRHVRVRQRDGSVATPPSRLGRGTLRGAARDSRVSRIIIIIIVT